jgi:hypothetical protein
LPYAADEQWLAWRIRSLIFFAHSL